MAVEPLRASVPQPHVRMRGVRKSYGGRTIIDGVDIDVMPADLCAVVGPSGCGKSTLLRMVLGQEEPDSGDVEIDGREAGYADARRGYVQQQYSLYPHLTALDNVLLGARFKARSWRRERGAATEQAMDFLSRVGLSDAAAKYPHELSGGMRQRVAIAQALVTRPKVLLMDEPFAALDPTSREALQMFLLGLWDEFRPTVFFVTHDISEALFLGTRIVLLSQHDADRPEDQAREGSRIVMDEHLDKSVFRVSDKDSPAFRRMREEIMRKGFNPRHVERRDLFDARFPNRFDPAATRKAG